ncbi:MAG: NADP-dependent oxidoreductase [Dehalococcoidia bacterium]
MPENVNRQFRLKSRPNGYPEESDFDLTREPIPRPRHGEILVKTLWLSMDPYMRGRMSEARSYTAPVPIGGIMQGGVVGRVMESKDDRFSPGEIVNASLGWQEYGVVPAGAARKVDPGIAPISTALGVLGMPGMTAYFGLLRVGRPEPGDTVVVSAASGAVGAVVGQVARIMGCRAVGIAGSDEKIGYITGELGFDAGINYKTEDVDAAIGEACPDGVNVYFDNVGGAITDAVINHLAYRARVAICGQISQYNLPNPEMAPRNLRAFLTNQASLEGFLVNRFADDHERGRQRMALWIKEGRIKYREDVVEGLENAPKALIGMMHGANFGKLLVRVSEE